MEPKKRAVTRARSTMDEDTPRQSGALIRTEVLFSGPLPLPSILAQYERILPGAAERIIRMAEKSRDDQSVLRINDMKGQQRERLLGQVFGFLIAVAFLAGGVYAKDWRVCVVGVATIVGIFVTGRWDGEESTEKKHD
jgi:uncharacterized membrane protein